jgi:hypothetical protein
VRVTKVGWLLIAFAAATAVVSIFEPTTGLVMAGVLAVAGLLLLAEGLGGGSDTHGGREEWAKTDADRRREVRHGPSQGPGPGGI